MNDYSLFRASVLKIHDNRSHLVTDSLGVYDCYKWLRKNHWLNIPRPLLEHEFYSIIRRVNNYLALELIEGNDIVFPLRMGKLEVRKYNPKIKFENGKLLTTLPIDWDATLKLWFEDETSYNKKLLIYDNLKEVFRVLYSTYDANYKNKSFYTWSLNREIKIALKKKIKEGALDAFIIK